MFVPTVLLGEDGTNSIGRGIHFKGEGEGRVGLVQSRFGGDNCNKLV